MSITLTCYAFGIISIASELGQRTSNLFTELTDVSLQFDWYLFPNEINQLLLIILPVVQKSVVIECFGTIACDRELFRKVGRCKIVIHFGFYFKLNSFPLGFQGRIFILYDISTIR